MVSTTSGAGSPSWSCAASQYSSVNAEPSCHVRRTTSARSAGYEWVTRPPVSDRAHAGRCLPRWTRCAPRRRPRGPLPARNLRHVVDDVDHPHLQLRRVLAEDVDGRERLEGRDVTAAG